MANRFALITHLNTLKWYKNLAPKEQRRLYDALSKFHNQWAGSKIGKSSSIEETGFKCASTNTSKQSKTVEDCMNKDMLNWKAGDGQELISSGVVFASPYNNEPVDSSPKLVESCLPLGKIQVGLSFQPYPEQNNLGTLVVIVHRARLNHFANYFVSVELMNHEKHFGTQRTLTRQGVSYPVWKSRILFHNVAVPMVKKGYKLRIVLRTHFEQKYTTNSVVEIGASSGINKDAISENASSHWKRMWWNPGTYIKMWHELVPTKESIVLRYESKLLQARRASDAISEEGRKAVEAKRAEAVEANVVKIDKVEIVAASVVRDEAAKIESIVFEKMAERLEVVDKNTVKKGLMVEGCNIGDKLDFLKLKGLKTDDKETVKEVVNGREEVEEKAEDIDKVEEEPEDVEKIEEKAEDVVKVEEETELVERKENQVEDDEKVVKEQVEKVEEEDEHVEKVMEEAEGETKAANIGEVEEGTVGRTESDGVEDVKNTKKKQRRKRWKFWRWKGWKLCTGCIWNK